MSLINFADKEICYKLVFHGPGGAGTSTSLEHLFQRLTEPAERTRTVLESGQDRVQSFDFSPGWTPEIRGFGIRLHLFGAAGGPNCAASRKLILKGTDGICFVVDSCRGRLAENLEELRALSQDLAGLGYEQEEVPLIFQYNKRDLPDAASIGELSALLNPGGRPEIETVAITGQGVEAALRALVQEVLARTAGARGSP